MVKIVLRLDSAYQASWLPEVANLPLPESRADNGVGSAAAVRPVAGHRLSDISKHKYFSNLNCTNLRQKYGKLYEISFNFHYAPKEKQIRMKRHCAAQLKKKKQIKNPHNILATRCAATTMSTARWKRKTGYTFALSLLYSPYNVALCSIMRNGYARSQQQYEISN